MLVVWKVPMPVALPLPHRSLEAVGLASGDVAGEKVLEGNVFREKRREEESLNERFRYAVQALQRIPRGFVPGRPALGRLGVAAVSPPVLAGVRAAVRKVAVDVGDGVRGSVVGKPNLQ